ncbi:MAG: ribonuclease R [Clostridia bacterium]|nr:ribonuclease R [Clostridia bacterium]
MSKKAHRFNQRNNRPHKSKPIDGVLSCTASGKFGFVKTDFDEEIYIDRDNMINAHHGDRVTIVKYSHNGKTEGRVTKVIDRKTKKLSAVIRKDLGGIFVLRADDRRFYPKIYIPYEFSKNAKIGERVYVELLGYDENLLLGAKVLSVLGDENDIKGRIDSIVLTHGIKTEFDQDTINEAEKTEDTIPEKEIENRLDLRGEKIVTIDGEDAKDFDDAVSIRRLPKGYRLGVHIADVSHYVKPKSALDREAYERGTSVYLPDRVIPMLPEKLSNGVCSLVPNEDRLTLSVIMDITSGGDVKAYKIEKSVINSAYRMTYPDVAKILSGDKALTKKYSKIKDKLFLMQELADILTKKRDERGSIDFDVPEISPILKDLKILGIEKRERLISHRIIEEFMLKANETVAFHAKENLIPIPYRTHQSPDGEKLENLRIFLFNFNLTLPKEITHHALKNLLSKIKDKPYYDIISKTMLRSMQKADYRPTPDGHFGLALADYCHFTSPIRRYPDLLVHRALKSGFKNDFLKSACKQSSEKERLAEECERDTEKLLKILYMKDFIGDEFICTITSLTDYGIYVETEDGIEGMIRLENIKGDYFIYDKNSMLIYGRRTGKTFKIGDLVSATLTNINAELLQIDFILTKDFNSKGQKKKWNLK